MNPSFLNSPGGVEALRGEFMAATARLRAMLELAEGAPPRERNMLSMSGGGSDGAFSVSLLGGWTDHGTRPDFHLVLGVSPDALIAPFAFIGTRRDAQLRAGYTSLSQDDVLRRRGWREAAFGDAIADNAQHTAVWNLGAIAASGHPRALDLARRILLASAAIPGLVPPTMFDVVLDGRPQQEMRVDGGTFVQSFPYPGSFGQQRRDRLRQGQPVADATA